jgi:hypothetical protein
MFAGPVFQDTRGKVSSVFWPRLAIPSWTVAVHMPSKHLRRLREGRQTAQSSSSEYVSRFPAHIYFIFNRTQWYEREKILLAGRDFEGDRARRAERQENLDKAIRCQLCNTALGIGNRRTPAQNSHADAPICIPCFRAEGTRLAIIKSPDTFVYFRKETLRNCELVLLPADMLIDGKCSETKTWFQTVRELVRQRGIPGRYSGGLDVRASRVLDSMSCLRAPAPHLTRCAVE